MQFQKPEEIKLLYAPSLISTFDFKGSLCSSFKFPINKVVCAKFSTFLFCEKTGQIFLAGESDKSKALFAKTFSDAKAPKYFTIPTLTMLRDVAELRYNFDTGIAWNNDTQTVYYWGDASSGKLMHPSQSFVETLRSDGPLADALQANILLEDLAIGKTHCLAVLAIEGHKSLFVWGNNDHHQLGLDFNASPSNKSNVVQTPLNLNKTSGIQKVFCMEESSFYLDVEGGLYAWGSNAFNKLGFDDTLFKIQKIPRRVFEKVKVQSVAMGQYFVCVLDDQYKAYGWGLDIPVTVGKPFDSKNLICCLEYGKLRFALVACAKRSLILAGTDSDDDLAYFENTGILRNPVYLGLGENKYGQLCLNKQIKKTKGLELLPLDNLNKQSIISISAGIGHFLVLTEEGTAYSWGLNNYGQCGVDENKMAEPASEWDGLSEEEVLLVLLDEIKREPNSDDWISKCRSVLDAKTEINFLTREVILSLLDKFSM